MRGVGMVRENAAEGLFDSRSLSNINHDLHD